MNNKHFHINGEIALTGKEVAKLPDNFKKIIADKVVFLLKKHKKHMLQFNQNELITKFFNSGDSAVLLDKKTSCLIGFSKNMLWKGKNEQGNKVYEFGSWIVDKKYQNKGYGHYLAKLASKTLKEKDVKAQLIAVCDSQNTKPINILKKLGALEISKPKNVKIILGEGQAKVKILNLSVIKY